MAKFIMKHIDKRRPQMKIASRPTIVEPKEEKKVAVNTKAVTVNNNDNKKKINEEVMTTNEKVAMAQNVLSNEPKRLKKDKGLIERTESSKTILTEDNKELLND